MYVWSRVRKFYQISFEFRTIPSCNNLDKFPFSPCFPFDEVFPQNFVFCSPNSIIMSFNTVQHPFKKLLSPFMVLQLMWLLLSSRTFSPAVYSMVSYYYIQFIYISLLDSTLWNSLKFCFSSHYGDDEWKFTSITSAWSRVLLLMTSNNISK